MITIGVMDSRSASPSPPPIHMLKSKPQCDGIWRWLLWEVIRVKRGHEDRANTSNHEISGLIRREVLVSLSACTYLGKAI